MVPWNLLERGSTVELSKWPSSWFISLLFFVDGHPKHVGFSLVLASSGSKKKDFFFRTSFWPQCPWNFAEIQRIEICLGWLLVTWWAVPPKPPVNAKKANCYQWTDGQTDGRTEGWMVGRMDGRADGWTDGRTDRPTDTTGCRVACTWLKMINPSSIRHCVKRFLGSGPEGDNVL